MQQRNVDGDRARTSRGWKGLASRFPTVGKIVAALLAAACGFAAPDAPGHVPAASRDAILQAPEAHDTPRVGNWLSRDPFGEAGGANLTAFCGNDPINKVDPLGLANQPGDFGWIWYSAYLPELAPSSAPPPPTFSIQAAPDRPYLARSGELRPGGYRDAQILAQADLLVPQHALGSPFGELMAENMALSTFHPAVALGIGVGTSINTLRDPNASSSERTFAGANLGLLAFLGGRVAAPTLARSYATLDLGLTLRLGAMADETAGSLTAQPMIRQIAAESVSAGRFSQLREAATFLRDEAGASSPAYRRQIIESFGSDMRVGTYEGQAYQYSGFGGSSSPYLTPGPLQNPVAELALPPSNPALLLQQYRVNSTRALMGTVAPQNFGVALPGGAQQIFVPSRSVLDPSLLLP